MITLENLDRTIFEVLRKKVVAKGYLPDILVTPNKVDYKAAKAAMAATKELIEVFGVGAAEKREAKEIHRITINRVNTRVGTLGAWGVQYYEPFDDNGTPKFKKYSLPDMTRTIQYQVRIITNSVKYERILDTIVTGTLGLNNSIRVIDTATRQPTDERINVNFAGDAEVSMEEFYERVYTYLVPDVFIGDKEDYLLASNIVPLETVSFCISLVSDMGQVDLDAEGCGQGDVCFNTDDIEYEPTPPAECTTTYVECDYVVDGYVV